MERRRPGLRPAARGGSAKLVVVPISPVPLRVAKGRNGWFGMARPSSVRAGGFAGPSDRKACSIKPPSLIGCRKKRMSAYSHPAKLETPASFFRIPVQRFPASLDDGDFMFLPLLPCLCFRRCCRPPPHLPPRARPNGPCEQVRNPHLRPARPQCRGDGLLAQEFAASHCRYPDQAARRPPSMIVRCRCAPFDLKPILLMAQLTCHARGAGRTTRRIPASAAIIGPRRSHTSGWSHRRGADLLKASVSSPTRHHRAVQNGTGTRQNRAPALVRMAVASTRIA